MSRARTRMARPRSGLDRVTLIVLIAFFIVACITAVLAFIWARNFFASWSISPLPGAPVVSGNGQTGGVNSGKGNTGGKPAATPSGPLQRANDPTPIPWDGTSRVTLLVMGLDYRDWSEGVDVPRTDSMILFSVDPMSKTAGMLAIPRDMWVNIPGVGYNKINTAYRWGEIYKLPGGGPGLAMKTVEEFLGVPVNYYALIDFNSFVKFIDELGGLDMKIREPITIDPIGPGNTRKLEPGTQTLSGAEVLAYARNRYTANDDFDRSKRQQEVIMAIRKQILQFNMLPTLIAKSPKLYQEISSGISTNLTLDQVVKLSLLASKVDEKNIKRGIIGPPSQVEYATSNDGQDILIPVPDQIRILRDEIFTTGGPIAPEYNGNGNNGDSSKGDSSKGVLSTEDLIKMMKDEKARVIVENGTSTSGLASKTSDYLRGLGINVVGEDNADKRTTSTIIYLYTNKIFTVRYLVQKMNLSQNQIYNRSYDPSLNADIVIVVGSDWAKQLK